MLNNTASTDDMITTSTPISDEIVPRPTKPTFSASLHDLQEPSWVEPISKKLLLILRLEKNWDGFEAGPIRRDVTNFAWSLLSAILKSDTPVPEITPMSHEGLMIEWHVDSIDIEIEIEEPGSAWTSFSNRRTGETAEWESRSDFSRIAEMLEQLPNNNNVG